MWKQQAQARREKKAGSKSRPDGLRQFVRLALVLLLLGGRPLRADSVPAEAASGFYLLPLRVHFLQTEKFPEVSTTLTEKDLERILGKANKVWAHAGIGFYVESLRKEPPEPPEKFIEAKMAAMNPALLDLRPVGSQGTNCLNLYYLKRLDVNGIYYPEAIFVKDTAALRPVEGGIDEPIPRVTSHEIGHALGLNHRQNTTNLMASGTTGTWLNAAEIEKARAVAASLGWARSPQQVLSEADALRAAGKRAEARRLYQALAAAPLPAIDRERAALRAVEE